MAEEKKLSYRTKIHINEEVCLLIGAYIHFYNNEHIQQKN